MPDAALTVGIDVGATLCKLAVVGSSLTTEHHPSADLAVVRRRVDALAPARVAATGGGASELGATLAGRPVTHVSEFDAWAGGAPIVAADEGVALPARYLLVSLGTGTSILLVAEGRATRVGGTALGGGTLTGLGALLLGVERFDEIASLAARGCRGEVDLLLGDVYPQIPIPDFTAAHFGKLRSRRPEDVAHALVGLVGETVALMAAAQATARGVSCVVYAGSTLGENPALARIVTEMTAYFGSRVVLLPDGAYAGAVGCVCAAASS
jgi:type II pantothenate kinase